jgi:hypothetical protein
MNPHDNESLPDNDWLAAAHELVNREGPGIEFDKLLVGDVLIVRTRNTIYRLRWLGNDCAEISANRPGRPAGRVTIMGCALGKGSSIAMNRLFCGGGLEYSSDNGEWIHRTSAIAELRLLRGMQ